MYAQEYSFYKRPDTSHVKWFTPQQLEAARINQVLAPVQVRQITPVARVVPPSADDAQSLLATAPALCARALERGLVKRTFDNTFSTMPDKHIRSKTSRSRHARSMKLATR